jgi:hypothetical protein
MGETLIDETIAATRKRKSKGADFSATRPSRTPGLRSPLRLHSLSHTHRHSCTSRAQYLHTDHPQIIRDTASTAPHQNEGHLTEAAVVTVNK